MTGNSSKPTKKKSSTGEPTKKKSSTGGGCGCKTGCKTKACSCRKAGPYCSSSCKCLSNKCSNREDPGSDVSVCSNVDTDKENDMNDTNGDDTDSLLNGTFEKPGKTLTYSNPSTPESRTPLGSVSNSIFKTPNSGADMFANDSDVEATPKVKAQIFSAPSMDCSQ